MVALKKENLTKSFNWPELVEEVASVFRLTKDEKDKIQKSPAARLSAEIAYLSGCKNPERVALSRIGIIVFAAKNSLFLHKPGESLYNRMAVLDHYPGGNPRIVKAGVIVLELISLYDHKRDLEDDRKVDKFNPLENELSFQKELNRLLSELQALDQNIQDMYKMYIEFLPYAWWT